MTLYYDNHEAIAKKIIERVGKSIVIALPLGIGKAIGVINALYRIVSADSSLHMTIFTALTLARPTLHNELEKRFIEPILQRMLKDYEDPLYEHPRELQQLPANIKVIEFFLTPGKYLHNSYVQQNYISSKYTSVVHDVLHYGVNVYAQQVSRSKNDPNKFSLSSNTDLFQDMINHLNARKALNQEIAIIAEVNANLPYMLGDAEVDATVFTDVVDTKRYPALFSLPREQLSVKDHMIGLYTSCLVKDGGCLQIGIGKLSNAVANALIFRHKHNDVYTEVLNELSVTEKFGSTLTACGSLDVFNQGLYASTEMLSDEFIQLYQEGILKKRVYDHIGLQRLLNQHKINEHFTPEILDVLLEHQLIHEKLSLKDVQFLQKFGIFKEHISYNNSGQLCLTSGEVIPADLSDPVTKNEIIQKCLGKQLCSGKIAHGGFFLGSNQFYQQLRNLSAEALHEIDMTAITRTNSVLWSYELSQLQRQQARLINTIMMATVDGALVSDGLQNLQEVSGVGGQFDFVNMAQDLQGARSIVNCHSTRTTKKGVQSNIVWNYSNITIPRYLRDIVVTEYGIADCRSKTDCDVIKAMLNICDSQFQQKLLNKAKKYGKLQRDYTIPEQFQNNNNKMIMPIIHELQRKDYCKPYPFGTDLTDEEQVLKKALLYLKNSNQFKLMVMALLSFQKDNGVRQYLQRMQLEKTSRIRDFFYKKLLKYALRKGK